ncbi:MAG: hypothetical protein KGL48_14505 [Sphingomonadales bacterium]|nr:hypothetical protein [Sphingomonadales bacterium]MDE2568520.1 hypothetical protein [Sphingomonadales bacterium]
MSIEVVEAAVSVTCLAVAARLLKRSSRPTGWAHPLSGRRAAGLIMDEFGQTCRLDLVDWSVSGDKLRGRCPVSGRTKAVPLASLRSFQPI